MSLLYHLEGYQCFARLQIQHEKRMVAKLRRILPKSPIYLGT